MKDRSYRIELLSSVCVILMGVLFFELSFDRIRNLYIFTEIHQRLLIYQVFIEEIIFLFLSKCLLDNTSPLSVFNDYNVLDIRLRYDRS